MPGFDVQPEAILTAGNNLATSGEDFLEQLAAFEAATAAYDGAWGDDTIGTYIGTAYVAVAQWALDCWHTVADELAAAGDDLVGVAEAYERVEADAFAALNALGESLG
ncbi:PE domain-containing protein [Micromonospora sp. WMMD558]|uniref:PE domain-containing protein n=1 Tax=unclassified Micromonospora TaxID=2617518 RepID=UPI0012B4D232|nr:PE domain-containing protein [Micromonospora sp. WMMC415]QGN48093.1 PE domain-containing protein [Micromonospora sp. WMMC415]